MANDALYSLDGKKRKWKPFVETEARQVQMGNKLHIFKGSLPTEKTPERGGKFSSICHVIEIAD